MIPNISAIFPFHIFQSSWGKIMKIKRLSLLLCSILILFFYGCANNSSKLSQDTSLIEYRNFYVVPSFDDRRGVKEAISADLKSRGLNVEVGPAIQMPGTSDIQVNYEAKWVWDNEYYLSDLVISFKDADSNLMIDWGESHHASHERKPANEMVGEVLDQIFQ